MVAVEGELPQPPPFLSEEGIAEWDSKVSVLKRMDLLARSDLGLLAALCMEWENYVRAEAAAREHGRYYAVKDEEGGVKYWGLHPAHTVAQQHLKAYIALCNEFGFSPASRSKIGAKGDAKPLTKAGALLKRAV